MSIIFAFVSKNGGCIATDSQRTDLKTNKPYFDAIKSKRIAHDLVVGYAGHSEPCEAILTEAIKLFSPSEQNFVGKFYQALEYATASFNKTHYNIGREDGKFFSTFLIVGYNGDGSTMAIVYGTATKYKIYGYTPIDNSPITFGFIPPDDVDTKTCTTIAIDTIRECTPNYSFHRMSDISVQKVVALSKWCGGETQILKISNHLH